MKMQLRAQTWAKAGWHVFPVRDNKKPYFADWQEAATTNAETIRGWWNSVPDAQVGIVPGMSKAFVLDVDVKDGQPGAASLAALEEAYGFKAETYPKQDTPSGGHHLFMRGYAVTSAGTLGPGLDTRGGLEDGTSRGYVLAYSDNAPAVDTLADGPSFTFGARHEKAKDTVTPLVEYDLEDNIERARKYLKGIQPAGEGGRNAALFKHAATLKDLGVGQDICLELCTEFDAVLGDPAIEDVEEIERTIASAYENGQAQPGQSAINPATIKALASEEAAKGSQVAVRRQRLRAWSELRDAPDPPWIVNDLLPGRALVGMFGPGGSYKSFIALDMALAIATGQLYWGGQDINAHGPVVFVSGEGNQKPRVLAWEKAHMHVSDYFTVLDGLDLSNPSNVEDAKACIEKFKKETWGGNNPILLVVDTLARASGAADENSNRDMGGIVKACDDLVQRYGCTVLLVHHTTKAAHVWRGASAVWNALDTGLSVRRLGDRNALVEVDRMKDGETGTKYTCSLNKVKTGKQRGGKPATSLVLSKVTAQRGEPEGKKNKKVEELERREKISATVRVDAVKRLIDDGSPNVEYAVKALAKQVVASIVAARGACTEEALRSMLRRIPLDPEHPLLDYVAGRDPLTFRKPKE